jgi:hypothetical protein
MKKVILNNNLIRAFVLVSSLVLSTFSAQANIILTFAESDIEVGLNDSFIVNLYAETGTPSDMFSNFALETTFYSSILSLDSVTLGNFVGSLADAAYFNPLFPSPIIGGSDILLASFAFTAIDYGSTTLSTINAAFSNVFSPNATIVVDEASANISVVSTPATLGLFAIALVGLVRLRRKA